VDWSLDRPSLTSGFVPKEIVGDLDFISVHLYPEAGKVPAALETLSGFAVGKPVVIEEMFPLFCSFPEFEQFLDGSRKTASGWIGFYLGQNAGGVPSVADAGHFPYAGLAGTIPEKGQDIHGHLR